MKTFIYCLTAALLCTPATAQMARPVLQNTSTKALVDDLFTGSKTFKVSSTGTLEWVSGATLTGASALRTALGLGSLALESTAPVASGGTGQTSYTNGQILIGNTTGNTLTKATLTAGSGISITNGNGSITIAATGGGGGGLTIGTTTTSGASANDLLISNGTVLQKITPGSGIATWLQTPSSANLAAALTDKTGTGAAVFGTTPTFTNSIRVNLSGQSETGGLEAAADAQNGAVRALYVVPPANNGRVFIGKSGQVAYALSFQYCSGIEGFPSIAKVGNMGITLFGAGSVNLDADFSGGGRVNISTTTTAGSLQVNNTYTSTTNFEGLRLSWASNVASVKPVAGGGGGTVRTAQYFTTGTVFWSSGAGSPEGAVTAPVGSLFTRTDGGASTTLYVKESGTGNTGWIAK